MELMSDRFLGLCRWFLRVLGAHRIILRAESWSMGEWWVEKPNAVEFVSYRSVVYTGISRNAITKSL